MKLFKKILKMKKQNAKKEDSSEKEKSNSENLDKNKTTNIKEFNCLCVCPFFNHYNINTRPKNIIEDLKKSNEYVKSYDVLEYSGSEFKNGSSEPGTDRLLNKKHFNQIKEDLIAKKPDNHLFIAQYFREEHKNRGEHKQIKFAIVILETGDTSSIYTNQAVEVRYFESYEQYLQAKGILKKEER